MLPPRVVDRIWARLLVRYGVDFIRRYEGVDEDVVKLDWAEVLSGFNTPAGLRNIAHALDHLPTEKPPNAQQFRELCNRAPDTTPKLQAPALSREEVAERAQALQRLQAAAASMGQMPDRATAIAVWQKALTNRSAGVRQMAAQALERLGNPATEVCEDQECL